MLHRLVFHLYGKVISLHLDKSTAKAYYAMKVAQNVFLSRLTDHISNLAEKENNSFQHTYRMTSSLHRVYGISTLG